MTRCLPFFSNNLEGQLCCHGVSVEELIEKAPLESVYYLLLMQKKPSELELTNFHVSGRDLRAQVLQEVTGKQSMYAPVMNVLQSLSACITVTYHDWDYLNQLLLTYSSFFEEELFFYENYDQQLWKLFSRRATLDKDYSIFQKVMSFLALSCYGSGVAKIISACSEARVTLPVLIATATGYNSGSAEAGLAEQFFPFFRELSLMTVEKKIKKYLKNKWPIPGFEKPAAANQEYFMTKSDALLKEALRDHKEWAPFCEVIVRATEMLKNEGVELRWLCTISMALACLGVEERLLAPALTFGQMPGWMGRYQYEMVDAF